MIAKFFFILVAFNFSALAAASSISSEFLNSDFYVVFGSSYIKGQLIEFLIEKKAINIPIFSV